MEKEIWIAIIWVIWSIIIASWTFYLNKREERKIAWKNAKYEKYKELLRAISDTAIKDNNLDKASKKFSEESNTICLVASQEVISALMNLHNHIKPSNKMNFNSATHDYLLKKLMLEIRKDIWLTNKDNEKTFDFHLMW